MVKGQYSEHRNGWSSLPLRGEGGPAGLQRRLGGQRLQGLQSLGRWSLSASVVSEPWGRRLGWAVGEEGVGCSVKSVGVTGRGKISRGTCQALKIRIPALSWCWESVYLKKRASRVRRLACRPRPRPRLPFLLPLLSGGSGLCAAWLSSLITSVL